MIGIYKFKYGGILQLKKFLKLIMALSSLFKPGKKLLTILKSDTKQRKRKKKVKHGEVKDHLTLKLFRDKFTKKSTTGRLFINQSYFCYTLEDPRRKKKIAGQTCILKGTYSVIITYSPKFKRELPLVVKVHEFTGIRFHPGNTAKDTEGCILVGVSRGKDWILESRKAFNRLFKEMKKYKTITLIITETH